MINSNNEDFVGHEGIIQKIYVKPTTIIKEVLNPISSRIEERFKKEGIDGVLNNLGEFLEYDYCGFVYYILNLKEDNQRIYDYIGKYLYELKERGIKKKLTKDVYLKINKKLNEKEPLKGTISILFTSYLDLFKELDDEVVNIIVGDENSTCFYIGANMILFYIDSFSKINIEKVLEIFFKMLDYGSRDHNKDSFIENVIEKVLLFFFKVFDYGSRDRKNRNIVRKNIIKKLIEAGYEKNVDKHLEDFGISKKEFDFLFKEVQKDTIKKLIEAGYEESAYIHLKDFGVSEKEYENLIKKIRQKTAGLLKGYEGIIDEINNTN